MENQEALPDLKILSIDAWADGDGGWTWNNWFNVGSIPVEAITKNWTTRKIIKWFRDNGYLSDNSQGEIAIDDDQYNIVILERSNRRPLYAIEYGNRQDLGY